MADSGTGLHRHLVRGTADGDSIRVPDLVAFDWRPDPGSSWNYFNENGHVEIDGSSAASGRVVFEGVSSSEAFAAQATGIRFVFTTGAWTDPESGFAVDSAVAGRDLVFGGPWTWDPASGVLDPHGAGGAFAAWTHFVFGAHVARWDGGGFYISGEVERGRWELSTAPTPAEVLAGDGADTVLGGAGDDRLLGGAGDDLLEGGDGADRMLGGHGRDGLEGGGGADTIDGQRGDDTILGGDGADVAAGGSGDDTLRGGAGRDTLFGFGGDDLLEGGSGADLLVGGADRSAAWGDDTASYAASPAKVSVDLATGSGRGGDAEGDRLHFIAGVEGSGFADRLVGDGAANRLLGGGGADEVSGGGGADTLRGGRGDDRLDGGDGDDAALYAGAAADYSVIMSADGGRAWVRDLNPLDGDEGTDALLGVERLSFADGTVEPSASAPAGPLFAFAATAAGIGRELWVTDGTAGGTRVVVDINPGPEGGDPGGFVALGGGRALFTAQTSAVGFELWVTDGTAGGTALVRDINPGPPSAPDAWPREGHSDPGGFVALGDGRAVFAAADGAHGRELWVTDGTAGGTALVRDIYPGPPSDGWPREGYSDPGGFVALGDGRALFTAQTSAVGSELWVTDGTVEGTRLVKNIVPGSSSGFPTNLVALDGGRVLFEAYSEPDFEFHRNRELWETDGTAQGTRLLKDIWPGLASSLPSAVVPLKDGRALFAADDGAHGRELWITDGTDAGTALAKDINPDGESSLQALTSLGGGRALFAADDGAHGQELWMTDGTAEGTRIVADINRGRGGASGPSGFTPVWSCGGDAPLGTGASSGLDPFG